VAVKKAEDEADATKKAEDETVAKEKAEDETVAKKKAEEAEAAAKKAEEEAEATKAAASAAADAIVSAVVSMVAGTDETPLKPEPAPLPAVSVSKTPEELQVNYFCRQFLQEPTFNERYLHNCKEDDCRQAISAVGCHYMSPEGFCWSDRGQEWCAMLNNRESEWCLSTIPNRVHTKCAGQGEIAQWEIDLMHSKPENQSASTQLLALPPMPATVNSYCNSYYKWVEESQSTGENYTHAIDRELAKCTQQDCHQYERSEEVRLEIRCNYARVQGAHFF